MDVVVAFQVAPSLFEGQFEVKVVMSGQDRSSGDRRDIGEVAQKIKLRKPPED